MFQSLAIITDQGHYFISATIILAGIPKYWARRVALDKWRLPREFLKFVQNWLNSSQTVSLN